MLRLVTAVLFERHGEWTAFPRRYPREGSTDELYAELPAACRLVTGRSHPTDMTKSANSVSGPNRRPLCTTPPDST